MISQCHWPQQSMWESQKNTYTYYFLLLQRMLLFRFLFSDRSTIQLEPSFPQHFPAPRGLMPIHRFLVNSFLMRVCQTCFPLKTSSHPDAPKLYMGRWAQKKEIKMKGSLFCRSFSEKMCLQGIQGQALHPKHAIIFFPFYSGQVTPYL